MQHPETCPGGYCAVKLCLGPHLDPDRWAACGDQVCGPCETAAGCPADCAPPLDVAAPDLADPNTVTVWVHGFGLNAFGSLDQMVYGSERGCKQFLKYLGDYGIERPCADTPEGAAAPNQLTAPEYYGGTPAPWLSPADVAEIEAFPYDGASAAERYARIIAKFLRWKLTSTGATHINLACHSMGCMLSRIVLERDLEGLVSEGRIARWYTFSGALAGARFARLYDNPTVQQYAQLVQMAQADYVILNPDFVTDHAAWWDHRVWEGNSPNYRHIFIQHVGGTDTRMSELGNVTGVADLVNPQLLPNDGVLFLDDEYFHTQAAGAAFVTADGRPVPSSVAFTFCQHEDMTYSDTVGMLGAAALFHHRKVLVTLEQVALRNDMESHTPFDGQYGTPPADLALESEVRFPWVQATYGRDVKAHEAKVDQRSAPEWSQPGSSILAPNVTVFGGPVFDAMDALHLDLRLVEVDWYPAAGVTEWAIGDPQLMAEFHDDVPLTEHEFTFEGTNATATVRVHLVPLY